MARKTNKELSYMSIQRLEEYGLNHPAEAARISKVLATSSSKMFKVSIKYNVTVNLKPMVEIGLIQTMF